MTDRLTKAEKKLESKFPMDDELKTELQAWLSKKELLDSERPFGRIHEKDIILDTPMLDAEFMTGKSICSFLFPVSKGRKNIFKVKTIKVYMKIILPFFVDKNTKIFHSSW